MFETAKFKPTIWEKIFGKAKEEKKEKSGGTPSDLEILKRIWREHTKKYVGTLVCVMALTALNTTTEAYAVSLLRPVLDEGFISQDKRLLLALCAQVVFIYLAKGWLYYAQSLIMTRVTTRTVQSIQQRVFSHLLSLDIGFFNKTSSGQMLARIVGDCGAITNIAINFITNIFKDLITCVSMFILMFYYSWQMMMVILVFFPLGALAVRRINFKAKEIARTNSQFSADFMSKLSESLQSIKIIKSYNMERFEGENIKALLEFMFDLTVRNVKNASMLTPVVESISGFILAGVILFGGWQIANGQLSAGGFVTFLGAWVSAYKPLKSLLSFRVQLQMALIGAARVYDVIDTKSAIEDAPDAVELRNAQGDIEFVDVTFAYTPNRNVLKRVSLKIPRGKTVALVGSSGGGKTTFVNLIPRFFDPVEGKILIDGIDIRKVTQKSLRDNVSLVSQEVILFDDTIEKNIAYGKGEMCDSVAKEDVVRAAKSANADEFIRDMPMGYGTRIGEKGVILSGGQKQRVSIARALIKDSPILLLDEATSALDTESEFEVQTALDNLMKNRTTVVIAHRLSTIKNADMICVVAEGRIVEQGTHKELLKRNGEYAKFYNMQFNKER
ncbi:MAG: ATP-binding cassette domain-containing protein [Synergistaceae bacterium]|jgi:subfamily B ATP-binding cassette protein MsbA|nr:ATP-binding cassette domain-containing protein [Synergistaceae bacterium]